jgi:hypothetical protein
MKNDPEPLSDEMAEAEVSITAPVIVWMGIIGNVGLALRHPKNNRESSEMMRSFIAQTCDALEEAELITPEIAAALRRVPDRPVGHG